MLKLFLPSWKAVQRYRDVIIFTVGLIKDPTPILEFTYNIHIEAYMSQMRTSGLLPSIDIDLLKSQFNESTVSFLKHPLHNCYINYYNHDVDDNKKKPRDRTFHFPSRVYRFDFMKEVVELSHFKAQDSDISECAMTIFVPDQAVTESLLSHCRLISENQPITDLFVRRVSFDGATTEALKLGKRMQSLVLRDCELPASFIRDILQQLHDCVTLRQLTLTNMHLSKVEKDLDELLENIVANHQKSLPQIKVVLRMEDNKLSDKFRLKWSNRCKGVSNIYCNIIENYCEAFHDEADYSPLEDSPYYSDSEDSTDKTNK